ncbi:MAG: OmpA family protein [Candidatus Izemoplasma sp.]
MEQLFGKYTVKEKHSDYVLETTLLLLFVILVSVSFLFNIENSSEIISEQLLPTDNSTSVKSSNLTILSYQIETIFSPECDFSLLYLPSISKNNTYYPNMMIREGNSPEKEPAISNNPKKIYTTKPLLSKQIISKPLTIASSSTNILHNNSSKIIYYALIQEFKNDLPHWSATIDSNNLTINFDNTIFNAGGFRLDQQYQSILTEFCPRYITILNKYAHIIKTISIEGHSSSEWQTSSSPDDAYINNMLLSQQRSNAVLNYCLHLPTIKPYKNWLFNILITSGLSSSDMITDNEVEDIQRSRRVEFKIYLQD